MYKEKTSLKIKNSIKICIKITTILWLMNKKYASASLLILLMNCIFSILQGLQELLRVLSETLVAQQSLSIGLCSMFSTYLKGKSGFLDLTLDGLLVIHSLFMVRLFVELSQYYLKGSLLFLILEYGGV